MKTTIFTLLAIMILLTSCNSTIYQTTDDMGMKIPEYTTILDQYKSFSYIPSEDDVSAEVSDGTCSNRLMYSAEYDSIVMVLNDIPCIYNDETGNIGCLCTDPLCMHNTKDCPYYGLISGVVYTNGKAYFNALDIVNEGYVYYELELSSGKRRELRKRKMGKQVLSQYFDKDYAYFYDIIYEENADKKTATEYYALMRQNLKTLEIEELERNEGYLDTVIRNRFGDVYLFRRQTDGNLLIAPADDMTNKTVIFDGYVSMSLQTEGDTIFFLEIRKDAAVLSSIRYDGSEYRTYPTPSLFDKLQSYYVTANYIYYMEDDPADVPGGGVTDFRCPRKIWRMNRKTEEITLAYEMDERLALVDIDEFIVKGNYIYAKYTLFMEDFQAIDDSEGYLRLGIEDGSIYLIEWD